MSERAPTYWPLNPYEGLLAERVDLLTGDHWAPDLCRALRCAQHSVLIAHYSLSVAWAGKSHLSSNVLAAILAVPARIKTARFALAEHKPHAASANFNRRAHDELVRAGWEVYRPPCKNLLLAKLIVIDGLTTYCGSHNLSRSNSETNIDVTLKINGTETAAAAAAFITQVIARSGPRH